MTLEEFLRWLFRIMSMTWRSGQLKVVTKFEKCFKRRLFKIDGIWLRTRRNQR